MSVGVCQNVLQLINKTIERFAKELQSAEKIYCKQKKT